jgi:hypothetical protein
MLDKKETHYLDDDFEKRVKEKTAKILKLDLKRAKGDDDFFKKLEKNDNSARINQIGEDFHSHSWIDDDRNIDI